MRIFLDVDEILVDFVGGVCREWRLSREDVLKNWPAGSWDMIPPLSKSLNRELSDTDFWNRIDTWPLFWEDLDETQWASEVLNTVHETTKDFYLVTSPSKHISSWIGKARWIKRRFGRDFDRFFITPHKHILAHSQEDILIDDRESNCEQWIAAGGSAIIFPAHHNGLHQFKHDPISHVRKLLEVPHALDLSECE